MRKLSLQMQTSVDGDVGRAGACGIAVIRYNPRGRAPARAKA
jgi:hypothetical protein